MKNVPAKTELESGIWKHDGKIQKTEIQFGNSWTHNNWLGNTFQDPHVIFKKE